MLKKQVAKILNDIPCKRYKCDFWDVQGNYCYANSADKNASYDCPMAESIRNLLKETGYVRLASDQINLPEPNLNAHTAIVMFKAGWRKVESDIELAKEIGL